MTKFVTNASGVNSVANFSPSYGVNFWVRCASGDVFIVQIHITILDQNIWFEID